MTLYNIYAAASFTRTEVKTSGHAVIESTGTHLERLFLGHYADAVAAMQSLLMAAERKKCFHDSRGWYEPPADLFHEIWERDREGTPRHIVARADATALTVTSEFVATLPGGLTGIAESFTRDYQLIYARPPVRTALLQRSITKGGPLPAEGE